MAARLRHRARVLGRDHHLSFFGLAFRKATGVAQTLFTNGYANMVWLTVSGDALGGGTAQTDLPMWFDETWSFLKSVANGGLVSSASGWDIRLEVGGAAVAYEREVWSPTTGRLAGWVDASALVPGTALPVALYFGNPAVVADEQNPAGVWKDNLLSVRMPDGKDMTGKGRDLTVSGVTAGTVLGLPAGVFATASYMEHANPTFLNGAAALSTSTGFLATSFPTTQTGVNIVRVGNATMPHRHALWQYGSFTDSGGTAHANYLASNWSIGAGNTLLRSPDGMAAANKATFFGHAVTSGDWGDQFVDGLNSGAGQPPDGTISTGTFALAAGDVLRIGANQAPADRGEPGSLVGSISRVLSWPSLKDQTFWAFHQTNLRSPRSTYGISALNAATDPNFSPRFEPVFFSVDPGKTIVIDLAPYLIDSNGDVVTASFVTQPSAGTASIGADGHTLTFVAPASPGTFRWTMQATDGAKTALAGVTAAVFVGGGGGGTVGGGTVTLALDTGYGNDWVVMKDPAAPAPVPTLTATASDVELKGGAVGVVPGAIGLVSRNQFTTPLTVELDHDPLDNNSDPSGPFNQLYLIWLTATDPNVADGPLGNDPRDGYLAGPARGVRFSWDTKGSGGPDEIRARFLDGSAAANLPTAAISTSPQPTFAFPRNVKSHVKFTIPGDGTARVDATISGTVISQSWSDANFATYPGKTPFNFVLTSYSGRDARESAFVVTPTTTSGGGTVGGSGSWPDPALLSAIPSGQQTSEGTGSSYSFTGSANQNYVISG